MNIQVLGSPVLSAEAVEITLGNFSDVQSRDEKQTHRTMMIVRATHVASALAKCQVLFEVPYILTFNPHDTPMR